MGKKGLLLVREWVKENGLRLGKGEWSEETERNGADPDFFLPLLQPLPLRLDRVQKRAPTFGYRRTF